VGGNFLFLVNKIKVSEIDKIPWQIGQNKNRIHSMNGIKEDNQPPGQTEIPERDRNDTFFLFLRGDPLNQEPHGKHGLSDEAEDQPKVQMELGILGREVFKQIDRKTQKE
jgi:hypothetical protein